MGYHPCGIGFLTCAHDRIIYDIYEEVVEVYILEVEGHYNDK